MGDNQPQTTPATNLDDKVDVTLVVITGDGSVGADHQAAVNTSGQVDVLACTHTQTHKGSLFAGLVSASVSLCLFLCYKGLFSASMSVLCYKGLVSVSVSMLQAIGFCLFVCYVPCYKGLVSVSVSVL